MRRPVRKAGFLENLFKPFRSRRVAPSKTLGSSGPAVFGGYIQDDETSSALMGTERYKTFSNMLANATIVAAGVHMFLNLVGKATWSFEPADDSAKAKEISEKFEDVIGDMKTSWRRVVRRAAMARMYGFSLQEWTTKKREDGDIGFADIAPRAQRTIETWDVDEFGEVHGVQQRNQQTMEVEYLPRSKLLYVVDDSVNDSPIGLGLFRHLVDTWRRLMRFEQLEGYAYETDLRGIPVGRAPLALMDEMVDDGSMTADQKANYLAGLNSFLNGHVRNPALNVLLDSAPYESTDEASTPSGQRQWDIEILTGGATSQEAIGKAIERLTREMARLLGVEGILLGEKSGGSMALSRDKSQNLAMIAMSQLKEICESVDADLIEPWVRLNGWDPKLAPSSKVEQIQHRDIEQITGALSDLAGSGLTRDDEAYGQVFDLLGLKRPDPDDEEDLMVPGLPLDPNQPQPPVPPGSSAPGNPPPPDDPAAQDMGDSEEPEQPAPAGNLADSEEDDDDDDD